MIWSSGPSTVSSATARVRGSSSPPMCRSRCAATAQVRGGPASLLRPALSTCRYWSTTREELVDGGRRRSRLPCDHGGQQRRPRGTASASPAGPTPSSAAAAKLLWFGLNDSAWDDCDDRNPSSSAPTTAMYCTRPQRWLPSLQVAIRLTPFRQFIGGEAQHSCNG